LRRTSGTPRVAAAIGLATQGDDLGRAASNMAAFALGAATPILLLAYGSRQAIMARRDRMARASRIGKPLMGAAFFGIGLFVLTGLDKIVETSLTNATPEWLVNVTTRL
jgi:cytochrome c-type biogenesis protein